MIFNELRNFSNLIDLINNSFNCVNNIILRSVTKYEFQDSEKMVITKIIKSTNKIFLKSRIWNHFILFRLI